MVISEPASPPLPLSFLSLSHTLHNKQGLRHTYTHHKGWAADLICQFSLPFVVKTNWIWRRLRLSGIKFGHRVLSVTGETKSGNESLALHKHKHAMSCDLALSDYLICHYQQ